MLFRLLALIMVLMAHSALAEPLELTVMSFNIRYGLANDGDNSWVKRCDLVVDTIKNHDPDILGLQECLGFQAAYLDEHLPAYTFVGLGREKDGGGEMTAIFYKPKELLPLRSGHVWLSERPDVPGSVSWDSSLTRMATWIQFRHWPTGTTFVAANTHFDHRGRDARHESAKLLSGYLKDAAGELPVVLTGDFNAMGGESAPWKAFDDAGYADAWEAAGKQLGPVTTWSGFEAPREGSERRIDWILTHGPVSVETCETVTDNENGRYPSDHFPVVARIQLPVSGAKPAE
jgi:endonuclease/exonuclease/phosphatase family metal-dependent hydrolase